MVHSAVFGYPAWLQFGNSPRELNRINKAAKEFTDGQDLLMIGVEKSGNFVTHFARIDQDKEGVSPHVFPSQVPYLLKDEYIKKNIIFSDSIGSHMACKHTLWPQILL